MSDGISEQRSRKMRCRKWISLVVRRCLYTPATEPVLQSIHYAWSGIRCSSAALRRHHKTLFNQHMEPKGRFFWKIIQPKSSIWDPRESLPLGMRVPGLGQITWWIMQTKEMRGNFEKNLRKVRNNHTVRGEGVGAHWPGAQIGASPQTKYKRSRIAFAVTFIALSLPKLETVRSL